MVWGMDLVGWHVDVPIKLMGAPVLSLLEESAQAKGVMGLPALANPPASCPGGARGKHCAFVGNVFVMN